MTAAGLRSLFRHHRHTTGVPLANPHRFRHYAASRTMPRGSKRTAPRPSKFRGALRASRFNMRHSPNAWDQSCLRKVSNSSSG
jgi:hypothetical protein